MNSANKLSFRTITFDNAHFMRSLGYFYDFGMKYEHFIFATG